MTSPRDLARSVYAAADALNEVVAAAVAAGLKVDLSMLERTALPVGRLQFILAVVSQPIPKDAAQ